VVREAPDALLGTLVASAGVEREQVVDCCIDAKPGVAIGVDTGTNTEIVVARPRHEDAMRSSPGFGSRVSTVGNFDCDCRRPTPDATLTYRNTQARAAG
jgi:hypothetical protein